MSAPTFPATVALHGCVAYLDGEVTTVSGLFDVVEFQPYEPANYVHFPQWILTPHIGHPGPDIVVDAVDFEEQVFPKSYGQRLEMERSMDLAEEART